MNIDFPFHFDSRGRTATTGDDEHVRDMIEQLLFTNPGERVNRPDFGSGLLQMVFAPNSPELATALQFTVQAALQRWLGDVIDVQKLDVDSEDATLPCIGYFVKAQRRDRFDDVHRKEPRDGTGRARLPRRGRRDDAVRRAGLNGLDFVEVADDQLSLYVYFFGRIPPDTRVANVRIEGGRRIRGHLKSPGSSRFRSTIRSSTIVCA